MVRASAQSGYAAWGDHAHQWRIEEQGSARSMGRCACGAERLFDNGWEGDRDVQRWDGGGSSGRAAAGH